MIILSGVFCLIDVEIKVKYEHHARVKKILEKKGAIFGGVDNQIDIYFKSPTGRLKLRKGNIENALVFYSRDNIKGIKPSEYYLYKSQEPEMLEEILKMALGELVTVEKKREMYFIDNVKFNLDEVKDLGKFIEIEAIGTDSSEIDKLDHVVREYVKLFDIQEKDIQSHSYSDLMLKKLKKN